MKKLCLILLSAVFCFVSCYDDSALQDSVSELGQRVSSLEKRCQDMNTNITSMDALINEINEKDFVSKVEPIKEGNQEIGYELTFNKGKSIKIYNGKTGETPQIGVKKEGEIYYWTVNGVWLLNENNEKIQASATDGKDAVLPQLKIQDGKWMIKVEGQDWAELGQATGDSFFKDVIVGEHEVTITLADGNSFVLPLKEKLAVEFTMPAKPAEGETVTVSYVITGAAGMTQVKAICQNGWAAKVIQRTYATGDILVTAPTPLTDDEIIVLITDEEGKSTMNSITWTPAEVIIANTNTVNLPNSAGTFSLTIDTNTEYTYESTAEWLKAVPATKTMRRDIVEFTYDENVLTEDRYAAIFIRNNSGDEVTIIEITQEAGKYLLEFYHDYAEVTKAKGEYIIPVKCQEVKTWTATSEKEWATVTVQEGQITVAVTENAENIERTTTLKISGTENGITFSDEILLNQLAVNAIPDLLDLEIQDDGTGKDISAQNNDIFTKKTETLTILDKKVQGRNAAIFTTDYGMTSTSGYTFKDYNLRPYWEDGYTLEAYVMCGVTPIGKEAKALSSTRSGGTALMISKTNKLTFIYNGEPEGKKNTWHFVYSTVEPKPNEWYHVVGTWDQATCIARIYINGILDTEINDGPVKLVHNTLHENSYMTVGANSSSGTYDKPTMNGGWNGGISIARMYSNPLTPEEVKAAYINSLEGKIRFAYLR